MVDLSSRPGKFLLELRQPGRLRRMAVGIALLLWAISFLLVLFSGVGHFYSISLSAVIVLAWIGGLRLGFLVGLLLPLSSIPISMAAGIPGDMILMDVCFFTLMTLTAGVAVGLLAVFFGYAASVQRELKLFYEFLPMCSHCQRIRDDDGKWSSLEAFVHEHSGAKLTHGICPDCIKENFPGESVK